MTIMTFEEWYEKLSRIDKSNTDKPICRAAWNTAIKRSMDTVFGSESREGAITEMEKLIS